MVCCRLPSLSALPPHDRPLLTNSQVPPTPAQSPGPAVLLPPHPGCCCTKPCGNTPLNWECSLLSPEPRWSYLPRLARLDRLPHLAHLARLAHLAHLARLARLATIRASAGLLGKHFHTFLISSKSRIGGSETGFSHCSHQCWVKKPFENLVEAKKILLGGTECQRALGLP